jgi:hypothetical protein
MPDVFLPQVHIDQALTQISIAYEQDDLVGDKIFPTVPVDKRSDRYFIYDRIAFKKLDDLVRPGSTAPEWTRTLSTGSYNAERHAQRLLVTDAEKRLSDLPLAPQADATEMVTERVQNQREFRQLAIASDPAQVTQNIALSGTSQWSDYTNSTPLVVIKNAKLAVRLGILKRANMFTASYEVAQTLADHPSIKDMLKYTDPNLVSETGLPAIIRGLRVNEAAAFIDTANPGQAPTMASAFGKNALIHYTSPRIGLKMITFGLTMEAPDDTTGARGFAVEIYRNADKHGDYVEVANTYDEVVVAPGGGYLVLTAVA